MQGSADLKALHQKAIELAPQLTAALYRIADGIEGAHVHPSRVKEFGQLEEKTVARPAQTIPDVLGGRLSLDTPQALNQVIERLRRTGRVIDSDDFLDPGKNGYRAIHLQLDLGNRLERIARRPAVVLTPFDALGLHGLHHPERMR